MKATGHIEKDQAADRSFAFDLCNSMGILTFLFLLFYFLVMRSMNLHEVTFLSAFNSMVLFIGLWLTYNIYTKKVKKKIDSMLGIKMGLHVTLLATIPFALFIGFYLHVDKYFMHFLQVHAPYGDYLDPNVSALLVCLQGIISGAILTFLLMFFYKKSA